MATKNKKCVHEWFIMFMHKDYFNDVYQCRKCNATGRIGIIEQKEDKSHAIKERVKSEGNLREHKDGSESRQTTKTGCCDSPQQSREKQQQERR